MPCVQGMNACRPTCQHRLKVLDYRAARHAAELAREASTLGYRTELAAAAPIITFRQYLEQTAREQA